MVKVYQSEEDQRNEKEEKRTKANQDLSKRTPNIHALCVIKTDILEETAHNGIIIKLRSQRKLTTRKSSYSEDRMFLL